MDLTNITAFPYNKKTRTGNFPIPIRGLSQSAEETLAYLKSMHEDIEDIRILTKDQNDIFRGRLNRPRAIEQSNREG